MDILTYTEKIEKLKNMFGQWPPPGHPWCMQVGGGRSGTNSLLRTVRSLIGQDHVTHGAFASLHRVDTGEITFDSIYTNGREEDTYQDRYIYYNVHEVPNKNTIESLHSPFFLYCLQHSPKIVLLTREDYFLRGISIYFADMISDLGLKLIQSKDVNIYNDPIDIVYLQKRLFRYIVESEALTKIVKKMVDPSRLCEVRFSDLYEHRTLQTLRDIIT